MIKIVFNTVEAGISNESNSSRRRQMREWGAVYISNITLIFNLTFTNASDNQPVPGVSAELVQTGNKKTSDANGSCTVMSKISVEEEKAIFHFEHVLFQQHADVEVPLAEGQLVYDVNAVLEPL